MKVANEYWRFIHSRSFVGKSLFRKNDVQRCTCVRMVEGKVSDGALTDYVLLQN